MEGVIYRYKSPSGKYYIGQTIEEEKRRRVFLNINKKYGGKKIDNARKKYNPENFEYTVLMKITGDNPEEVKQYLNTLEIGFIRMYDSYNTGYNSTEGGEGVTGFTFTEETIQKLKDSHKGQIAWNKGKIMSESTRKKIGLSKVGNKNMLGHKHSEESKKRMSEHLKGKVPPNKGKPMSEEQKNRIKETKKFISGETRKRMSDARKGKHRVYTPDGHFHFE